MEFVAAIGLAASLITCIESTGALLKKLGPSDHSRKDLKRILKTLCGFKGTYDGLKLLLEFNEEDQARLSTLEHLKEPLKDCESAVELLRTRLEGVGFLGKYVTGTFWDRGLAKALKTLNEARSLFETVLNADHDIVLKAVERYIRNVAEDVRDVQATVNANAKRLLDLEGSSRQSQEETKRLCMNTDAGVRRVDNDISVRFQAAKAWCRDVESSVDHVGGSVQAAQREARGWKKDADQKDKDAHKKAVYQWLSSVDPSTNHNAARRLRERGTGEWFLGKEEFVAWKVQPELFIWLHGIPGCGKTVLSSTVIESITAYCQSDPSLLVAYFYFDFNDKGKQLVGGLLGSLIVQLTAQLTELPQGLDALYLKSHSGQHRPNVNDLLGVLKDIIMGPHQIYLVVDALDECTEKEELLQMIENATSWKSGNLHLITTSRRERDLEEVLQRLVTSRICIQNAAVDADIERHVSERLMHDFRLKKWDLTVREDIKAALVQGANGMFRWVVCQLDALRKCFTLPSLREKLRSLPKTLNDTYERILVSCIDEVYAHDAIKILQYLAFSARPMLISELAEVLAIDFGAEPHFCVERRLPKPRDILQICSSLVVVVPADPSVESGESDKSDGSGNIDKLEEDSNDSHSEKSVMSDISDRVRKGQEKLQLAHFSVKEYLTSTHIQTGPASHFSLTECSAQAFIAKTCLAYLLQFDGPWSLSSDTLGNFPLCRYGAKHWTMHAAAVLEGFDDHLDSLIVRIFGFQNECFANWIRLFDPDSSWEQPRYVGSKEVTKTRLYYAAQLGLMAAVKSLLNEGVEIDTPGGTYGLPLQVAARGGHLEVVETLLDKGANVNAAAAGLAGRTALQAAAERGHLQVVNTLLDKGADVNADAVGYTGGRTALQAAAEGGHLEVVETLLDKGANVNAAAAGLAGRTALQAAAERGHLEVVETLLDMGADVNAAAAGVYGGRTALQASAESGHLKVVNTLLDKGADFNVATASSDSRTALLAAAEEGHVEVVEALLDKGADVNVAAVVDYRRTALQAAAERGHLEVVKTLLDAGANVNAAAAHYGGQTALQAAAEGGYLEVVKTLLNAGADVNDAATASYGSRTALQAAAERGHLEVVKTLLDAGANVNAAATASYGSRTALQAAAERGHLEVVKTLLDAGANVNAAAAHYGGQTALQASAERGHLEVVKMLLDKGAGINAAAADGRTALRAAAWRGHIEVVDTLKLALLSQSGMVSPQGILVAPQGSQQAANVQ